MNGREVKHMSILGLVVLVIIAVIGLIIGAPWILFASSVVALLLGLGVGIRLGDLL